MKLFRSTLNNLLQDESGQDLIEYALVAGLIGLAAVGTMGTLATDIKNAFTNIGGQVTAATPAAGA